jgi:hypothetical protein
MLLPAECRSDHHGQASATSPITTGRTAHHGHAFLAHLLPQDHAVDHLVKRGRQDAGQGRELYLKNKVPTGASPTRWMRS